MLADLNGLRAQCGGTALPAVSTLNCLIVSSVRHAGYQSLYDTKNGGASLDHGEPDSTINLYTSTDFWIRIEDANSGQDVTNTNEYYEDIASQALTPAMDSLWNTVFHRLPMMRHQVTSVGYGDMAMARSDYPTAGIPTTDAWGNTPPGNGYATLDFAAYPTPAITLSWWPLSGTTGVPPLFVSTTESPNPLPSGPANVGPPLHMICPTTLNFTSVTATLSSSGGSQSVYLLVGGATTGPAAPTSFGGQTSSANCTLNSDLNAGELFLIPLAPLASNTVYTYSITAVDSSSASFSVASSTFTTGN
jgi:hypothetical protein